MRWSVWLLVAVLAVAGVVAACGGGAPEREVGSQRPAEQEAGSQSGASGGDAADDLADALEADDDRRAAPASAASSSSERPDVVTLDPVATERAVAAGRSSSDAAGAGGVMVGGVEVPDGAIRIEVSPMVGGLAVSGPNDIPPVPLPLQFPAGAYSCAVEVDRPAPDEAGGRLVVTFGDFDESGSEAVVEAAGPEWSGEARLEVEESEDEEKMTATRAIPGIVGSMEGRVLTATIESELSDGMWKISCQRVDE